MTQTQIAEHFAVWLGANMPEFCDAISDVEFGEFCDDMVATRAEWYGIADAAPAE